MAVVTAMLALAGSAAADTFTVTTNADSGAGSLRQAALDAEANDNSPALDDIAFDLPLTGSDTITLLSALPPLDERVSINGCSGTPNHAGPCVGLRKNDGMAEGFVINANSSTIRGFAFSNIYSGVKTLGGTQLTTIKNNWFGMTLDGVPEPMGIAIDLEGSSATVGGPDGATGNSPADRNVISGATTGFTPTGVRIDATTTGGTGDDNQLLGNYFGTDPTGNSAVAVGNTTDIQIVGHEANGATDNVIGGTADATEIASAACDGPCNVIGGATYDGIALVDGAQGTMIAGNYIGLGADGISDVGNGRNGIAVEPSEHNGHSTNTTIGGDAATAAGDENVISYNVENPIRMSNQGDDDNLIGRNRGSGNGGQFIDLGPVGRGNKYGPNKGIEAPAISAATSIAIAGTADPNAVIRVFKKNDATAGEIAGFVGQTTADASGDWSLVPPAPQLDDGQRVTATQTGADEYGELGTSELATNVTFHDNAPPTVSILTFSPASPNQSASAQVTYTDSDASGIASESCNIDYGDDGNTDATIGDCQSGTIIGNLPVGPTRVTVTVTDNATNAAMSSGVFTRVLPPPPPAGNAPPPDKAIAVSLAAKGKQKAKKPVVIKVGCAAEACAIVASAKADIRRGKKTKHYSLKKVKKSLAAGQSTTLKLKASKKSLKAIKSAVKKRKKVTVKITVTARDALGNTTTINKTIKLVR